MVRTMYRAVLLLLLSTTILAGQNLLTLDQCIMLARERSLKLQMTYNLSRSTELSNSEILTTKLPQIKFGVSTLYAPVHGHVGYDPAITDGGLISGRLIVEQSLYDGGIRSLKSDQLEMEAQQRDMEFRVTERDLIYAVRCAYIEVLRARTGMELQRQSVTQLTEYLELINQLIHGGNASQSDLLKTRIQLSNAQTAFQKAEEEFELGKYSLAELIGFLPDTSVAIIGSLETLIPVPADSVIVNYTDRISKNLEMSLSQIEFKKSRVDIELAHHEIRPVILIFGDAGVITSGDNMKLPQAERSPALGYSFGMNVDFPLFNWGANDLRVQQKELASENQRLQTEWLLRSLDTEMKRLRFQLQKAHERLLAVRSNISTSEENYLLTKSKYVGGAGLSLEVLSAQQLLTDARICELQTLADIQEIQVRIEQLLTN